jgi:hypothetical protein
MDVTTETALRIISKLPENNWHRRYWIGRVQEEIEGYKKVKLNKQAQLLEIRLNVLILKENK